MYYGIQFSYFAGIRGFYVLDCKLPANKISCQIPSEAPCILKPEYNVLITADFSYVLYKCRKFRRPVFKVDLPQFFRPAINDNGTMCVFVRVYPYKAGISLVIYMYPLLFVLSPLLAPATSI
jgi:hypothetical protein